MYDELDKLKTFFPELDLTDIEKDLRDGFVVFPEDLAFMSNLIDLAGHKNVSTTARYDRLPEQAKPDAASKVHFPYRRRKQGANGS